MAFFKFRTNRPTDTPRGRGEAAPAETVESLRRRSLYRLIGAAVLLVIVIIGFPLLFDNQPRPVAVNAPISIPSRDQTPPLNLPASDSVPASASLGAGEEVVAPDNNDGHGSNNTQPATSTVTPMASAQVAPLQPPKDNNAQAADQNARDARAKQPPADAKQQAADAKQQAAKQRAAKQQAAQAAAKRDADKRKAEQQAKRAQDADAARARALLNGQDPSDNNSAASAEPANASATSNDKSAQAGSAASKSRYLIQIGAFADTQSAQAALQKAEHAGIKAYTQTISTSAGQRVRVRAGPFANRDEAERAQAKLKQAGLAGSMLPL